MNGLGMRFVMIRSCRMIGFTLVEVMIVVAIVAIIAALGIPAYLEHVNKGRRGEAMAALLEGAQALERYYSANGTYLDGGNLAAVFRTQVPPGPGAYYNIAAQAATANTFRLRAARAGVMVGDDCGDFEITHSGARELNGNTLAVERCWRR